MIPDPIIIAGCPRSGTSLTAGVIHACGAFVGEYQVWPDNARGTFENLRVLSLLHRRWNKSLNPADELRNELFRQGYKAGPWLIKLSGNMLLDKWIYARNMFPGSFWVIVQRNKKDIMASHQARDDKTAMHRIRQSVLTLSLIKHNTGLRWREVWPQKIIDGDFREMKKVVKWLGLSWNKRAVDAFVDPDLWHHGLV